MIRAVPKAAEASILNGWWCDPMWSLRQKKDHHGSPIMLLPLRDRRFSFFEVSYPQFLFRNPVEKTRHGTPRRAATMVVLPKQSWKPETHRRNQWINHSGVNLLDVPVDDHQRKVSVSFMFSLLGLWNGFFKKIWDSILDEINQAIDFMVIFMDFLLNPDVFSSYGVFQWPSGEPQSGEALDLPDDFGGKGPSISRPGENLNPGESLFFFFPEQTAFLLTPIFKKILISVLRNPRVHSVRETQCQNRKKLG